MDEAEDEAPPEVGPPPSPLVQGELPPGYALRQRVVFAVLGLIVGVSMLVLPSPDREKIIGGWLNELPYEARRTDLAAGNWRMRATSWPTVPAYIVGPQAYLPAAESALDRSGLPVDTLTWLTYTEYVGREVRSWVEDESAGRIVLLLYDGPNMSMEVTYWTPRSPAPVFILHRRIGAFSLYGWRALVMTAGISIAAGFRAVSLYRYRSSRRQEIDRYADRRTQLVLRAREHLTRARELWTSDPGSTARALAELDMALRLMPSYSEARDLRRLILNASADSGRDGVLLAHQALARAADTGSARQCLYLRIAGTPYAFQAPVGASTVTVGRQRRHPGDGVDAGNDIVVRVPGSDARSQRISRQHLVFERVGEEYLLTARGRRTVVDGRLLECGESTRVQSGSQVSMAGVTTLEVAIRRLSPSTRREAVTVDARGVEFEATVGNLVTIVEEPA